MSIICCSGGFDPIHSGHLDLFDAAALHGKLCVLLNSDAWLVRKKGYAFLNFEQRKRVIASMACVYGVLGVDDTDGTVCKGLQFIRELYPDEGIFFANGGDRFETNTPEVAECKRLGIGMLFNVGGGKVASSSELVNAVR